jgi:hypothetical protein
MCTFINHPSIAPLTIRFFLLFFWQEALMFIQKDHWLSRLFFWALGICDEFTGGQEELRCSEKGATNLCFLTRVIFLYLPLVLAIHLVTFSAALGALFFVPVMLFGWGGYGTGVAWVIACIVALVFIVLLIGTGIRLCSKMIDLTKTPDGKIHGLVDLLKARLGAMKAKVCPQITFSKQEEEI